MTRDDATTTPAGRFEGRHVLRMHGPADMAAMLPYLLGFYPDDSLVVIGLHGSELRQGGAVRLDIPADEQSWPEVAADLAELLLELSEERGGRPDAVLIYLCREPDPGGPVALAGLRPLAEELRRAFRGHGLLVKESLCLSAGRWWSFLCADLDCCPPHGTPVHSAREPRAVVAAATFAGLAPRGSRRAIAAGLAPIGPPEEDGLREAVRQELARACDLIRAEPGGAERTFAGTVELLEHAMAESRSGPPRLTDEQSARLIVGLLDRASRDRAAEYAEPDELAAAQRLWRYLARRCVAPYAEYAKAPLTLLAWTSWLAGDIATSRVVLGLALDLDPEYTLAILLHESLNTSLPPDGLLSIVRAERARRRYAQDRTDGLSDRLEEQLDDGPDGPPEPDDAPPAAAAPLTSGQPGAEPGQAGSGAAQYHGERARAPWPTPRRQRAPGAGAAAGGAGGPGGAAGPVTPAEGGDPEGPPAAHRSTGHPELPRTRAGRVPRPRGGDGPPAPPPPAVAVPRPGRGPLPGGRGRRIEQGPAHRGRRPGRRGAARTGSRRTGGARWGG
ncbi:DUF4192 domain-containing protein [Kitasatospora sp. NPDC006697]|uniref:DUF4192 domain-containing protein n=1 Tax=Kitasatospora sp. NPDC006697 TaxID=3364020 RepID=UPI0036C09481